MSRPDPGMDAPTDPGPPTESTLSLASGFDDEPTEHSAPELTATDPVARTVYLRATDSAPGSHGARLVITFLLSFWATTFAVLGTWAVLPTRAPPEPPQVQVVEVERPVAVPVPVPVPVPATVSPPVEAPPAPTPARAPVAASRPRQPEPLAPSVVVAAPVPVPAPVPAPSVVLVQAPAPPPPSVPVEASALTGSWQGRAGGEDVTARFVFLPDGALAATVTRPDGTVEASGRYEIVGGRATFTLIERGADSIVWSGTAFGDAAAGRLTAAGRNLGKFELER